MTQPLCCARNDPADLEKRRRLIREMYAAAEEARELADGFAMRFHGDDAHARLLLEFITFERSCCPFLIFELEFGAEKGPIWMSTRGPSGVKDFARAEVSSAGLDPAHLLWTA